MCPFDLTELHNTIIPKIKLFHPNIKNTSELILKSRVTIQIEDLTQASSVVCSIN